MPPLKIPNTIIENRMVTSMPPPSDLLPSRRGAPLAQELNRLSPIGQKILLTIFSRCREDVDLLADMYIPAEDLISGSTKGGSQYAILKDAANAVYSLSWDKNNQTDFPKNKKGFEFQRALNKCKYEEGFLVCQLSTEMADLITLMLNNKIGYTTADYEMVVRLKSSYSRDVYLYLAQYRYLGKPQGDQKKWYRETTLADFRTALSIPDGVLAQWCHLQQRVLKIAMHELSSFTDLAFTYTTITNHRTVMGLHFEVLTQIPAGDKGKKGRTPKGAQKLPADIVQGDIFENTTGKVVIETALSAKEAKNRVRADEIIHDLILGKNREWALSLPAEMVLYYYDELQKQKKVPNPGGWLFAALRDDQMSWKEKKRQKDEEAARVKLNAQLQRNAVKLQKEKESEREVEEQRENAEIEARWDSLTPEVKISYLKKVPPFVDDELRGSTAMSQWVKDGEPTE